MSAVPQTPTNPGARLGSQRVNLPVGNKNVESLLLWRDPRKSGIVLAGITVIYILLEWSHLSLLRIVSHTLLAAVTLSFLWNNIASFTNRPGVPIPAVMRHGLSESQVRQFAENAVGPINKLLECMLYQVYHASLGLVSFTLDLIALYGLLVQAYIKRVISGQEVILSIQVAVALYVFGRLGNYFTSLALAYILVLLAFTVPKGYEMNKDEVDNAVSSVQKQTSSYYKQYAEPYVQKIPRASTSTANTGSVTAGNHANTGDSVDSYTRVPKPDFESADARGPFQQGAPKKYS